MHETYETASEFILKIKIIMIPITLIFIQIGTFVVVKLLDISTNNAFFGQGNVTYYCDNLETGTRSLGFKIYCDKLYGILSINQHTQHIKCETYIVNIKSIQLCIQHLQFHVPFNNCIIFTWK